jgi:hypothetical protein
MEETLNGNMVQSAITFEKLMDPAMCTSTKLSPTNPK